MTFLQTPAGFGFGPVRDEAELPLLAPMPEVAGRLSPPARARALEKHAGGKGLLLTGVSGVRRGRVTILGAGTVGFNACAVAVGLGADVTILDVTHGHVTTLMSNTATVAESVEQADLVIGGVPIPGALAPRLRHARAARAHGARIGARGARAAPRLRGCR